MEIKAEKIKPYDSDRAKTAQVREMFDSIAPAYDWMNRAMSFGLDRLWRSRTVKAVAAAAPKTIVDIATGTGDLAIAIARRIPGATVTGIDLSEGMIAIGRRKVAEASLEERVKLVSGDCMSLPLPDETADAVTVAYGVRNFEHLERGYSEMLRVLRPGGLLCVLELSVPVNPVVKPFYRLYAGCLIPVLGRAVSKDPRAYKYLPESIAAVPQGDDMAGLMRSAGFTATSYRRMSFGVCTLYTARKPC